MSSPSPKRPPGASGNVTPARTPAEATAPPSPRTPRPPPPPRPPAAPVPARPAPVRPAIHRPGTPTPAPVRRAPDQPDHPCACTTRPLRVGREPPTPRVPRAERVLDLEHHVHRHPVRPSLQRRAQLHQPYVQRVAQLDVAPAYVRDEMQNRIVDRPVPRLDRRRQVDLEEEPPQRRVRRRVQRRQVVHGDPALGARRVPVRLDAERRVPDDLTRPLRQQALQRRRPLPRARRVDQRPPLPAGTVRRRPRPPRHQLLVHAFARSGRLVRPGVPQADLVRAVRHRQPHPVRVDLQGHLLRGRPVSEPAVDRGLRGRQHGEGFTQRPDVVELTPHHRGQQAAPAVRGRDTYHRHAGCGHQRPAGHGEPEAEGPRRTDHVRAVPDADRPLVLGQLLPELALLRRIGHAAERELQAPEPFVPFGRTQHPQLSSHMPCLPGVRQTGDPFSNALSQGSPCT